MNLKKDCILNQKSRILVKESRNQFINQINVNAVGCFKQELVWGVSDFAVQREECSDSRGLIDLVEEEEESVGV